jgi:integrative and conjugative element protein (TIGR02256 family)
MIEVFVAEDHSVAIMITEAIRKTLLGHCETARQLETGGILIGHYTPLGDQAVITEVTGPPRDSIASRWSFIRGLHGLQQRINRAWRRRDYYLGEWHFHPFARPIPSDQDRTQIIAFSIDPAYRCPEPILLVVGGDPRIGGELGVGVVLKGKFRQLRGWVPVRAPLPQLVGPGGERPEVQRELIAPGQSVQE